MRGIRLFVIVLMMSILIVPFISCSKKEDEEKQTSTTAAQSSAPAQHEVVSTVQEFLMAIDAGDYDRAIELCTPNVLRRDGLIKINEIFNFNNVEIAEAYVGNKNSAVLTNSIHGATAEATVQFGFSLVKSGNRWLIRDVDMLPNDKEVQDWFVGFKDVEPTAKRVVGSD